MKKNAFISKPPGYLIAGVVLLFSASLIYAQPTPLISLGFNENSGSSVGNTGSSAATFSKSNPPSWSANVPKNGGTGSVDFGESHGDYYIESASVINELAGLKTFTVTGWVNNRSSSMGAGGNRIVSWIENGGDGVDIVYRSDGAMQVGINDWSDDDGALSSTGKITTDPGAQPSNWRFFAVTYESSTGSGSLSFYFGDNTTTAVLDKTISYNQGAVGTNIGKLAIGHFNGESDRSSRTNRMFRGLIDEVEIYGSVLSLPEIQLVQNIGPTIAVTGVGVSPTTASVNVGATTQLTATVSPSNASNQNVGWSSSNTAIATVSSSGLVTGVGGGTAIITVTTEDGGHTATCNVTVTVPVVSVTGVSVSPTTSSVNIGGNTQLTATITPSNAANQNVSWSSNNTSVAIVSSSGLVTGRMIGSATITVTTDDGGYTATCNVTVTILFAPVTGVTVSPTNASVNIGGNTQLTATVSPLYATNKNISWSSSNTAVARVNSSGLVTGVSRGSAVITATTEDGGHTATCTMTVTESTSPTPLISLGFNEKSGSSVGNTGSVSATLSKTDPPSWSTNVPKNGGAGSVDFGTSDGDYYIESASIISELAGLKRFTVTGWVNNRSSSTGAGGNRIVSWIKNGGDGVDIVYKSDGAMQVGINDWPDGSAALSSIGKITTNSSAPASNWRFFAVTYESSTGSGSLSFYFGDNTTTASLDKTISYNQGAVGTGIGKLAVGHFNGESDRSSRTSRMFRGLIDKVEIYGSVLSLSEIQLVQNIGPTIPVSGVSVSPTTRSLNMGATTQLTATVSPSNASNQKVNWSSSNTAIATVNSSGLVTGVAGGTTTITATTQDGGHNATCNVTVTVPVVPVTGVGVSPTTTTVNIGGNAQLTATVSPSNAPNQNVSWSSSNTAVAMVSSSGLVTGVAEGTATITVTTVEGGFTATCIVTVTVPVTGVSVYPSTASINAGATTQLTATISPPNATNRNASWSSNNTSIATVNSSGLVTGVAGGTAVITVTTEEGGKTGTCIVTVAVPLFSVTGVAVSPATVSINSGTTTQLSAIISPLNAANQNVSWGSNNTAVAIVSSSGLVTGVAEGSAVITVTTEDRGYSASCNVTVTKLINTYSLNISSNNGLVSLTPVKTSYQHGDTVILHAVPDAGCYAVEWSGDLQGSQNPDTIIMYGNKSIHADFKCNTTDILTPYNGKKSGIDKVGKKSKPLFAVVPNPSLKGNEPVHFFLNTNKRLNAVLTIYSSTADMVYKKEFTILPNYSREYFKFATWNHRNRNGKVVSNGSYLASIKLTDGNGKIIAVYKSMIGIIR